MTEFDPQVRTGPRRSRPPAPRWADARRSSTRPARGGSHRRRHPTSSPQRHCGVRPRGAVCQRRRRGHAQPDRTTPVAGPDRGRRPAVRRGAQPRVSRLPARDRPLGSGPANRAGRPPGAGGGHRRTSLHTRFARLGDDEVVDVGGIRVTSVARTLVDLGRWLPFESAVVSTDDALHRGLVTVEELAQTLARGARAPRAGRARQAIAFADARTESVGESRSRVAMHEAGLPAPDVQIEVRSGVTGAQVARSDFGWHERRTVGEFDGFVKYGRLLRPASNPVTSSSRRRSARTASGTRGGGSCGGPGTNSTPGPRPSGSNELCAFRKGARLGRAPGSPSARFAPQLLAARRQLPARPP